jgi:hypothetical protein
MKRRHKDRLANGRADDADARGEHMYPDRPRRDDTLLEKALERDHYAAGADGTQMVSEPDGAALAEEEEQ